VVNDQIVIREMLKMSIQLDHDVMDGDPMARCRSELSEKIEKWLNLLNNKISMGFLPHDYHPKSFKIK